VHHMRGIGPLGMTLTTFLPEPLLVTGTTHINVGQLLASLRKLNHRHVMNIYVSPVGPTAQIRFKSPKQLIFP